MFCSLNCTQPDKAGPALLCAPTIDTQQCQKKQSQQICCLLLTVKCSLPHSPLPVPAAAPACAALGLELTTVPATFTGSHVMTGNLQSTSKVLPSLCPAFGTTQLLPQGAAFFFIEPATTARTFTLTTCVPAQNAAFVLQSYVSSGKCWSVQPQCGLLAASAGLAQSVVHSQHITAWLRQATASLQRMASNVPSQGVMLAQHQHADAAIVSAAVVMMPVCLQLTAPNWRLTATQGARSAQVSCPMWSLRPTRLATCNQARLANSMVLLWHVASTVQPTQQTPAPVQTQHTASRS